MADYIKTRSGEKIHTKVALYNYSMTDAIEELTEEVMDLYDLDIATARKVIKNALIYNCVQDEILGQIRFMLGADEGDCTPEDDD